MSSIRGFRFVPSIRRIPSRPKSAISTREYLGPLFSSSEPKKASTTYDAEHKVDHLSRSKLQLDKGLLNMWFDKEIKDFELYTKHSVFNDANEIVDTAEFELLKFESAGAIKY